SSPRTSKAPVGHLPTLPGMETVTGMAPPKMCCMGWQSTHQICLANYGFSTSSNHVASTQNADYAGVSEAVGLPTQRSVTSRIVVGCQEVQCLDVVLPL